MTHPQNYEFSLKVIIYSSFVSCCEFPGTQFRKRWGGAEGATTNVLHQGWDSIMQRLFHCSSGCLVRERDGGGSQTNQDNALT